MNNFAEEFGENKDYYLYLLKNKSYGSIIKLYKNLYPTTLGVDIKTLGIKFCSGFEEFCLNNNFDLIYIPTRKTYQIKFDNKLVKEEYIKLLKVKIKDLSKDINFLESIKIPNLYKQIKLYEGKLENEQT